MNLKLLFTLIIISLVIAGCGKSNQLGPDVEDFKQGIREITLDSD